MAFFIDTSEKAIKTAIDAQNICYALVSMVTKYNYDQLCKNTFSYISSLILDIMIIYGSYERSVQGLKFVWLDCAN